MDGTGSLRVRQCDIATSPIEFGAQLLLTYPFNTRVLFFSRGLLYYCVVLGRGRESLSHYMCMQKLSAQADTRVYSPVH